MPETVSMENGNANGSRGWHLVEVEVSNYRSVKYIRWVPSKSRNTIAGKNGAGKSQFIEAFCSPWAGGFPGADVVRHGAYEASINIHLKDGTDAHLYITKIATNPDKWKLEVRDSPEGKPKPAPKEILSKIARIIPDPSKFARITAQERVDMLLQAMGLGEQLRALAEAEKKLVRDREDVGRDLRNKKGELEGIPFPPLDTPDELVDTADLVRQKNEIEAVRAANAKTRQSVGYYGSLRDAANTKVRDTQQRITSLREEIRRLEAELEVQREDACTSEESYMAAKAAAESLVDPDLTEIDSQLSNSKTINAAVANKQRWQRVAAERDSLKGKWDGIDADVKAVADRRIELLASAPWPCPGLGFDSGDLTFNGSLWSNLSAGERVKVSTAIVFALNPDFQIVLISEGAWLDKENMEIIYDMAEERGALVLCERQLDTDPDSIIIEDGEIVGAEEVEPETEVAA